jgi:hypothetical protein
MRKLLMFFAVAGLLMIGPASHGQDPKADKKAAAETTLTGCLKASGGSYTLTDKAGKTVAVTGSADLAKHANHQVQLTGTMSKKGDQEQLSVTAIKHVAPSCEQ